MATKNTNLSFFNKEDVPNAKGLTFGIVVSEWNPNVTEKLYKGAYEALSACGAESNDIKRYNVPGSFELVYGAKIAAKSNPDVIICIGSIIKGETKHFDFISNAWLRSVWDT